MGLLSNKDLHQMSRTLDWLLSGMLTSLCQQRMLKRHQVLCSTTREVSLTNQVHRLDMRAATHNCNGLPFQGLLAGITHFLRRQGIKSTWFIGFARSNYSFSKVHDVIIITFLGTTSCRNRNMLCNNLFLPRMQLKPQYRLNIGIWHWT